jgi:Bromodomain
MPPKAKSQPSCGVDATRWEESGDLSFSLSLFSSCSALLEKLMSHRHGWLFNEPVDVKKLRLKDYYSVIRHTMDLGTVRCRIVKGRYKSPLEFASDVRLTFRNAMTYNRKGDLMVQTYCSLLVELVIC